MIEPPDMIIQKSVNQGTRQSDLNVVIEVQHIEVKDGSKGRFFCMVLLCCIFLGISGAVAAFIMTNAGGVTNNYMIKNSSIKIVTNAKITSTTTTTSNGEGERK